MIPAWLVDGKPESKAKYERLRDQIIDRYGYDQFRLVQRAAFKRIGEPTL